MIKELTVLSGKGGTGKTSIAASLAALADNKVLVDCDVDAANLHLLLRPLVRETVSFKGMPVASIKPEQCTGCGICEEHCRFGAIEDLTVIEHACEGCGFCNYLCPAEAVEMVERVAGQWFVADSLYGPLVHAQLSIGQENCGKLVNEVKKKAHQLAREGDYDLVIVDGPPGIGCPVLSSLTGSDYVLVVTEPTLSGQHDLERVLSLAAHFSIPALVCINKRDLSLVNALKMEAYCIELGVEVVGKIDYDPAVYRAMSRGVPVVELRGSRAGEQIREMWHRIELKLNSPDCLPMVRLL